MISTLGSRVKMARIASDLTQAQLAERLGCSQQAVTKIENNQSRGTRFLPEIAKLLNISPAWLQYGEAVEETQGMNGLGPQFKRMPATQYIPLVDWLSVPQAPSTVPESVNYIPFFKNLCSANSYALWVKGDSMISDKVGQKSFLPDEIIVITPERRAHTGDYVIAQEAVGAPAIFRQYSVDGARCYLMPLNSRYPVITMTPAIDILGVVVGHMDNQLVTETGTDSAV